MNDEEWGCNTVTKVSTSECKVSFEIGVAEKLVFSFLDREELEKYLEIIAKKALRVLDVLCVVRYHREVGKRKIPLKFDYYILRFLFHRKTVELQIFHERGTRRVSSEELATFITDRISSELKT